MATLCRGLAASRAPGARFAALRSPQEDLAQGDQASLLGALQRLRNPPARGEANEERTRGKIYIAKQIHVPIYIYRETPGI